MTENYLNTSTREPWIEYLLDQLHITSCPRYGNALHGLYIETGQHQGQRPRRKVVREHYTNDELQSTLSHARRNRDFTSIQAIRLARHGIQQHRDN